MRLAWRRVAERGDKHAFAAEEISHALIPALDQDCRAEIAPAFLDALCHVFREQGSSLFKDQVRPQLDALRGDAGCGIGRVILDHSIQVAECGGSGMDGLVEATTNALTDRAARGARQVEEHYCRKSSSPRGQRVRTRIEEAIAGASIQGLARQILKVDPRPSSPQTIRRQGLDDGVRL